MHRAQYAVRTQQVGCAESGQKSLVLDDPPIAAEPPHVGKFPGVLHADLAQPLGDRAQGFFPADFHPTGVLVQSFARIGTLHRRFDPVGVVQVENGSLASRAQLALADGVGRVALHFHHHTILDGNDDRAPGLVPAHPAGRHPGLNHRLCGTAGIPGHDPAGSIE